MFGGVNPPGTPPFLCVLLSAGEGGERTGGGAVCPLGAWCLGVWFWVSGEGVLVSWRVFPLLSRWEQGFWGGVFFLKIFLFW